MWRGAAGAWILDQPGDEHDVLIGTIIGGSTYEDQRMGTAFQPSIHPKWVDEKLAATGDKAVWAPLPEWVQLTPLEWSQTRSPAALRTP